MKKVKVISILFWFAGEVLLYSQTCTNIYYPRYNDTYKYVYTCALDGSGESYFTTALRPECIAVDWNSSPHKLYIGLVPSSGNSKIIKCDLDGTNQTDVVTEIVGINDIELDLLNRKIYWLKNTYSSDGIFKADMDGENSGVEQIYSANVNGRDLWGLALNASSQTIWFTERGSTCYASYVKRMTTSGASLTTIKNPICNPHDIEYYNGDLYLGTLDGLERLETDGSVITTLLADANVDGLAIDGTNERIFWVDYIENKIKRIDLDGSNETDVTISHSVLSRIDTDYNLAALPVELLTFTAEIENNSVSLYWQTATEVNNYGFEVERQKTEFRSQESDLPAEAGWDKVGFVQGHGNSNSPKSYSFLDNDYDKEKDEDYVIKYRLKQIDTDGSYEYFGTIAEVNVSITQIEEETVPKEFLLYQNYPNPFNPVTTINYRIANSKQQNYTNSQVVEAMLKVYNALGIELETLVDMYQHSGYYHATFDGRSLSSGVYFYSLIINGKVIAAKKMILSK